MNIMAIMTAVMIATYFFKLDLKFEYDNLNNSSCTPMFFSYQIILIYNSNYTLHATIFQVIFQVLCREWSIFVASGYFSLKYTMYAILTSFHLLLETISLSPLLTITSPSCTHTALSKLTTTLRDILTKFFQVFSYIR